MKKTSLYLLVFMLCSLLFAGVASAHVVVYPKETTQGAYEKFTVRVPSEKKDVPTVKVEVRLNVNEVSISRIEPKPGWKYDLTKDATGAVTAVTWTATGDGLSPTEFAEFNMQGKVADKATAITWKAYQTYKDGSVVEWVGGEGSDTPASVTKVNAKPAGAASGDHDHGNAAAASPASSGSSQTPLILSVAALVLGALALIVALLKKRA
jgi:uncharacterized protein YcnI